MNGVRIVNGKYSVSIDINDGTKHGKNIHLGTYTDEKLANKLRIKAEQLREANDIDGIYNLRPKKECCNVKLKGSWMYCPICGVSKFSL